jgi:hypothetical protein
MWSKLRSGGDEVAHSSQLPCPQGILDGDELAGAVAPPHVVEQRQHGHPEDVYSLRLRPLDALT